MTKVFSNQPWTYENSSNPWIMDRNDTEGYLDSLVSIDGHKLTAAYLWTLNSDERRDVLEKVFNYYREKGFPYEEVSEQDIIQSFHDLVEFDVSSVINDEGYISNSGSLCLNVCRFFNNNYFWKAKGDSKSFSIEDVFYDDQKFKKVLRNRMGWNTSKEDGTIRPYLFGISDVIIRQGIRNSGLGYGVSNFRPTIAKLNYTQVAEILEKKKLSIYDYSAGWGARALAAASLGYDYVAVDPLTADNINTMIEFLNQHCKSDLTSETGFNGKCYKTGAEDGFVKSFSPVDLVYSCPPYFTLERYSEDETQSYNETKNYKDWINLWWRSVVKNSDKILNPGGVFGLVIKDKYLKFDLMNDMCNVIEDFKYKLIKDQQYKTSKSHLTNKKNSKVTTKTSEHVLFFQKP